MSYTVSAAASERYWASAGVDHEALRAGALYPPIAANLTILAFQTIAPRPLLHTAQRVIAHQVGPVGSELTVNGWVTQRFRKRDREYVEVGTAITLPHDQPLWTSVATFVEADVARGPHGGDPTAPAAPPATERPDPTDALGPGTRAHRTLALTADSLRAYSRRGNFHSDADAAAAIGYSGLVAQGMQVAGPAYGLLLDTWGEPLLTDGTLDLKFVGIVTDDQTVDATVSIADRTASLVVQNSTTDRTAVVGSATVPGERNAP